MVHEDTTYTSSCDLFEETQRLGGCEAERSPGQSKPHGRTTSAAAGGTEGRRRRQSGAAGWVEQRPRPWRRVPAAGGHRRRGGQAGQRRRAEAEEAGVRQPQGPRRVAPAAPERQGGPGRRARWIQSVHGGAAAAAGTGGQEEIGKADALAGLLFLFPFFFPRFYIISQFTNNNQDGEIWTL